MTIVLICLLYVTQSWAQFKINKHSINNGGGVIFNPDYQITGSIGQKEASNSSTDANYILTGGFWSARINEDIIFNNGFE